MKHEWIKRRDIVRMKKQINDKCILRSSIDRLLMATILTVYMALMWTIDSKDYNYHMSFFKQKQIELS